MKIEEEFADLPVKATGQYIEKSFVGNKEELNNYGWKYKKLAKLQNRLDVDERKQRTRDEMVEIFEPWANGITLTKDEEYECLDILRKSRDNRNLWPFGKETFIAATIYYVKKHGNPIHIRKISNHFGLLQSRIYSAYKAIKQWRNKGNFG